MNIYHPPEPVCLIAYKSYFWGWKAEFYMAFSDADDRLKLLQAGGHKEAYIIALPNTRS